MENPIDQGARIRDLRNELRRLEVRRGRSASASMGAALFWSLSK